MIAQVKPAPAATRLPVKRVILYKNGVGYFEHLGPVSGNQMVSIDFTSAQLNDALKSLTTLDLGGGQITGVSYNSQAPLARQLDALRLPLNEKTTRASLFEALRGARVSVRGRGGITTTGRILSFERRTRERGSSTGAAPATEIDQLVLVSDDGSVHTVDLDQSASVSLVDADMRRQVGSYLDLVSAARAPDLRRMLISTTGEKQRPLFVSYISEVPVWKTTYRIVLPSAPDRKPLLQGWAIIDNTIGEDWTNVELSLVAGAPQSFIQQLSQPYYGSRPVVPLPTGVSITPQTHDSAMRTIAGGSGSVVGDVKDPSGAILPGVMVEIRADQGDASLKAVTDEDGHYEFENIPSGRYHLMFSLAGFRTSTQQVAVTPDEEATVDATMDVAQVTETVQVSASTSRAVRRSVAPLATPPPMINADAAAISDHLAGGIAAAASSRDLGDLFEYHLKEHVTIRKNESALVPIVSSEVGVEKVSLWREDDKRPRPLRALWLTNNSGLTLDGGSFMVIEGEAFAGEGLMDSMKPAERRLISYALDLGVVVAREEHSSEGRVTRITIARGVVTHHSEQRRRITYTARNEDVGAREIILEHPNQNGYQLVSGPKPEETTAAASRFRLHAGPKSTMTLTIEEVHPLESQVYVSLMTDQQIAVILTGQALTPATQQSLQAIRTKKAEIAALSTAQQARASAIANITKDQERIRENLKALQAASGDKSLIARYTRQLATQEDRLEVLRRETDEANAQRQAKDLELGKLIQTLSADVSIPAPTN
jgi:hypothetical protein